MRLSKEDPSLQDLTEFFSDSLKHCHFRFGAANWKLFCAPTPCRLCISSPHPAAVTFLSCLFFQTCCCPLNPILQKIVFSQTAAVKLLAQYYLNLLSGAINASLQPSWKYFSASLTKLGVGRAGVFLVRSRGRLATPK